MPAFDIGENGVVVINPGNTNYQYLFNGVGLQYSPDGGQTFTTASTILTGEWTFSGTTNRVAVDPGTPSTVYLAGNSGIFQSTDWGETWTLLPWNFANPSIIVVGPDETIFVATPNVGTTSGSLYFSHDAGATWTTSQLPASTYETPNTLTVNPNNPAVVLLGMTGVPTAPGGGVLISTDGGATFSSDNQGIATRPTVEPADRYTFSLQFAPPAYPGLVAASTVDGMYVSQAGGTWTDISGSAIPRWFQGIAWDSGYLYVSTYGEGVLRTPIMNILSQ